MIPEPLKRGLDNYAERGIPTGSFLRACLANDFGEACCRADADNALHLRDIALYIHNDMPSKCHGSYEVVDAWVKKFEAALGSR